VAASGEIWRRLSGTGPLRLTPAALPLDNRDVVVDPADRKVDRM
jgi:hypothetical protein